MVDTFTLEDVQKLISEAVTEKVASLEAEVGRLRRQTNDAESQFKSAVKQLRKGQMGSGSREIYRPEGMVGPIYQTDDVVSLVEGHEKHQLADALGTIVDTPRANTKQRAWEYEVQFPGFGRDSCLEQDLRPAMTS